MLSPAVADLQAGCPAARINSGQEMGAAWFKLIGKAPSSLHRTQPSLIVGRSDEREPTASHGKGSASPRSFSDLLLFSVLSRSRQHRLCRVDDEQGHRPFR